MIPSAATQRTETVPEALRMVAGYWQTGLAVLALGAFLALALVVPSLVSTVFNSPDETSNYIFTKTFAAEERLWYENPYLPHDEENLLHPRGVLTHEGKAVPFNFLGLPVIYGLAYKLVGDYLELISVPLAAACAWCLYRSANLLFDARAWESWAVSLGFTPLIYYLNHPYMNVTLATTFLLLAVWLTARYYRFSNRLHLVLASAFLALSIFCRYEYVLFLPPLLVWVLFLKHGTLHFNAFLADSAIVLGALFFLFAAPLALLNQMTYGNWRTYGYSLFNDVYFPERNPSDGLSTLANLERLARGVFLPSYPVDTSAILTNLSSITLLAVPIFSLLGILGLVFLVKNQGRDWWKIAPFVLMALYILVYRGSNDTWRAFSEDPGYNAAAVRYWMPFYVIVFFFAAFAFTSIRDYMIKGMFVVGLLATGAYSVYAMDESSLLPLRNALVRHEAWAESTIVPNVEPEALVYVGKSDKRIVPVRDVAAWWNGEEFYDPQKLAASINRVSATGRPTYVYREKEVDIPELNAALAPYHLTSKQVGKTALFKILPAPAEQ